MKHNGFARNLPVELGSGRRNAVDGRAGRARIGVKASSGVFSSSFPRHLLPLLLQLLLLLRVHSLRLRKIPVPQNPSSYHSLCSPSLAGKGRPTNNRMSSPNCITIRGSNFCGPWPTFTIDLDHPLFKCHQQAVESAGFDSAMEEIALDLQRSIPRQYSCRVEMFDIRYIRTFLCSIAIGQSHQACNSHVKRENQQKPLEMCRSACEDMYASIQEYVDHNDVCPSMDTAMSHRGQQNRTVCDGHPVSACVGVSFERDRCGYFRDSAVCERCENELVGEASVCAPLGGRALQLAESASESKAGTSHATPSSILGVIAAVCGIAVLVMCLALLKFCVLRRRRRGRSRQTAPSVGLHDVPRWESMPWEGSSGRPKAHGNQGGRPAEFPAKLPQRGFDPDGRHWKRKGSGAERGSGHDSCHRSVSPQSSGHPKHCAGTTVPQNSCGKPTRTYGSSPDHRDSLIEGDKSKPSVSGDVSTEGWCGDVPIQRAQHTVGARDSRHSSSASTLEDHRTPTDLTSHVSCVLDLKDPGEATSKPEIRGDSQTHSGFGGRNARCSVASYISKRCSSAAGPPHLQSEDTRAEDRGSSSNIQPTLYMTVYAYEAVEPDECELKVGDVVTVFTLYDDGWAYGRKESSGFEGVLPQACIMDMNEYVAIVREVNGTASAISRTHG